MTSLSFSSNGSCREDKKCIFECLYYCLAGFVKNQKSYFSLFFKGAYKVCEYFIQDLESNIGIR